MKSGKAGKMATALTVLLLVLSGLAVVQWNAQSVEATEDSDHTYMVEGFLDTEDGDISIDSDLDIKLRDLSTGENRTEKTKEAFYSFSDVSPGWYEIILPSQVVDGIAYMRNSTELRVDENKFEEDITVAAEEADETVEGYIYGEDGEALEEATVTLQDKEKGFVHSVETETELKQIDGENKTFSKYEIGIYKDFEGLLKVEKDGYTPYVNPDFSLYSDLTVNIEGNGEVEVDGEVVKDEWTKEYKTGAEVDLTALPEEGWSFEEWTGDSTGTNEDTTITMDEDKTVVANFAEEVEMYDLTVDYNNSRGSVEVDSEVVSDGWTQEYDNGTEVSLEAIPESGYVFENWTMNGMKDSDNETVITMDEDKTVVANFAEEVEMYGLTVNYNNTQGTVEVDGTELPEEWTQDYENGTEVSLEAIPESGYVFENWTINGENHSDNETVLMMDEDKLVNASFREEVTLSSLMEEHETYYNVSLSMDPKIEGRLVDDEGRAIREVLDVTIHNEEIGVFQRTIEEGGPGFSIGAPANYDYTLVVDAPGYEPLVKEVEELGELGRQKVSESGSEQFETDIEFEEDFDKLTIYKTRTLNSATRMKTLDFSNIGNLRMQIDLTLGDGNGNVSEDEAERFFENRLEYSEADIPTTYDLLTVNHTLYELTDYEFNYDGLVETLKGPVTEHFEEIEVSATRHYEPIGDVGEVDAELVNLTVQNDHLYGNERDFTFTLDLPDGYERYIDEGSAELIPENVEVDGYVDIRIDPGEDGMTSDLTFDIRESEDGDVEIIMAREPWIYEHEDKENYTDFVIRKDTEATITAQYENPISHALNYTWLLDGEEIESGEDASELIHAFNDTGEMSLEVIVEESSGNVTNDQLTIMVEDEGPQGESINVDGDEIGIEETVTLDEKTEAYFNASDFEDAATAMISNYEWNFTDTNETRSGANMTNVSHTFTTPGTYDVILNLTDPVGNWNEVEISVEVKDTTDPMAVIKAEWNDQTSEASTIDIPKNTKVNFNGTGSKAHPNYEGNLTFEWEIEELGISEEGPFFNYTFEDVDEYTVTLYATDEANNTGNKTMVVNTLRGETPNLRVSDLEFSSRDVRAGNKVKITVNITNDGDANATQLNPVLRVDGDIVDISPVYYQDYQKEKELNETRIEPGEKVTMEIEWTPENSGDLTVTVNVTDGDEPSDLYWNNEVEEESFTVDQPAWREYLVYALIPIIIIGVTVGLYFYRDKLKEMLGR